MIILKTGDMPTVIAEASKKFAEMTDGYAGMEGGLSHLSPSSMSNLDECALKMPLRKRYRFYSIYAKLGNIFHGIFEQYGRRKLFFMQQNIEGDLYIQKSFDDMKYAVTKNLVNETRTAVITGQELLPQNVPEKIKDQIGDMKLFEKIAMHITSFVTMKLCEDAAIDGKFPIMQEAELRGILGTMLPVLGYSDSIKVSQDMETVYVDDYKTTWTPTSRASWEKTHVPTRQFWIYLRLVEENIRYFVPSVKRIIPRLVLVVIDKSKIKQAMSKANKGTTLKDVPSSIPEISLYIKELPTSPAVDSQYEADIALTEVMLTNGIAPVAKSKYGCASCEYNSRCPYYKEVIPTKQPQAEETDGSK